MQKALISFGWRVRSSSWAPVSKLVTKSEYYIFFFYNLRSGFYSKITKLDCLRFNPLPHMPILGSSNSAANKNMMSKIWTNQVQLSD